MTTAGKEILAQAMKDLADKNRHYKELYEITKHCLEVGEMVIEWQSKVIKAQAEELMCYKGIVGN